MAVLFRAMKEDAPGVPEEGTNARTLGIRPGKDVAAVLPLDLVHPGQGGMSVSPDDPMNLPYYRRPPVGKDPVWSISENDLGPTLCYRPDPTKPTHGFIEPVISMTLDSYQQALAQLKTRWQKVQP